MAGKESPNPDNKEGKRIGTKRRKEFVASRREGGERLSVLPKDEGRKDVDLSKAVHPTPKMHS